ncbi:alpha/beta fold hydrolase [Streptomyces sp. NPDC048018]|uniref:alpha/beta fold hydrolase n=1 Tax=Streptomyces sp. NPDC048018 TaxID=3365499 RepID=UPI0037125989
MRETDLALADGRSLHVYDSGGDGPVVLWHHGTPNIGTPPRPLFPAGDRLGVRWVAYDRPGYGGSGARPGRTVGSAAEDVRAVADALGIGRFGVLGHSGGGPHALACAALLPGRVTAAVGVSGLAPYEPEADRDWFAGMTPSGEAGLRAALRGRAAKEAYEASAGYDPEMFTPADHAALTGDWAWFDEVVGPALAQGPGGLVDDDLAYVAPWGFRPEEVAVPVLLLHGERDRVVPVAHAHRLAARCPAAELRLGAGDGHLSVLREAGAALEWLAGRA